jgi:hypothetical protein
LSAGKKKEGPRGNLLRESDDPRGPCETLVLGCPNIAPDRRILSTAFARFCTEYFMLDARTHLRITVLGFI